MSLARKRIYASLRVVVSPYLIDSLGCLRPTRPLVCPLAMGGPPCKIESHGWRRRKCGPGYPLALCYCNTHELSFTVYPPSWPPFGRRPVVDVSPAGHDVVVGAAPADPWTDTAFGAATDAAAHVIWPQSHADDGAWRAAYGREPYGTARTQRRHIAGINALFALTPKLDAERPTVVAALGLDLADIVVAAGRVRDGPELVAEGAKGADLLRALGTPRRRLLAGILRLGVDREYWGPPSTDPTGK